MKVWLKLLIGSILGICLGFLLPQDNQILAGGIAWLAELSIRIGRYVLVPVMVFSLTIAVYELRQDGRFWGLLFRSFLVMVFCSVLVISAGIFAVTLFPPARIPILNVMQAEAVSINPARNILELFPSNMFAAVLSDGVYLLPACFFAFFMGVGLSYDRNYTKPVILLFDSLSRIFYYVAAFFSEALGLLMIVLSAFWALRFSSVLETGTFKDLILLLGILGIVLICVILPVFLYFVRPKINPWVVLYGSLSQALAAFFSGDINFTLPVMLRHVKENLGVRRRSNAVTVILFAVFGRAGSAMVAVVSFIVIMNSYSSLDISAVEVFSIGIRTLSISFLLFAYPGGGAYAALISLCIGHGHGFEAGYLILKPLAFYIIAIGTFIDVMIASIASYAIGRANGFQEDREIKRFI